MALRWLAWALAAALCAGCTTKDESDAALFGFCKANAGRLECDQGVCPCVEDFPDAGFVCFVGKCRLIDGDTCFADGVAPTGQACGCASDCVSGLCAGHHCQ